MVMQRIKNNAVTEKTNSDTQLVCHKKKPTDKSMVFKYPKQILSFDSRHIKHTVFNYNSMCYNSAQIFQKSTSHLKILCTSKVTQRKLHT